MKLLGNVSSGNLGYELYCIIVVCCLGTYRKCRSTSNFTSCSAVHRVSKIRDIGSETWTLQTRHMKKLQATKMRYLRKVEGVTRMDRLRSGDIRERLRHGDVLETVLRKKRQWRRKIEEMPQERLVKTGYVYGGDAKKETEREITNTNKR